MELNPPFALPACLKWTPLLLWARKEEDHKEKEKERRRRRRCCCFATEWARTVSAGERGQHSICPIRHGCTHGATATLGASRPTPLALVSSHPFRLAVQGAGGPQGCRKVCREGVVSSIGIKKVTGEIYKEINLTSVSPRRKERCYILGEILC